MPLLILVALIVLVAVIVRLSHRRPSRAKAAAAPVFEPPTFRVVAVGPQGVGKSVYLSSLFHTLNFRAPGRSYHLETDPEQRVALANVFDKVSDTAQGWPRGTRAAEAREYVFDCVASDARMGRQPVLRMSCLDFAGDVLQREQEAGSTALQDLTAKMKAAHAVLGMIDGQRVLELLRGEPAGHRYFFTTVRPMFGLMQETTCPIHLVLTKWDLIRDFGEPAGADDEYRLARVIEALTAYEHIRAVAYSSEGPQTVRIIPVSAVGPSFAEIDGDGRMVKRKDGEVRPTNVEVPFCAVLPDLFRQAESGLEESDRKALRGVRSQDTRALVRQITKALSGPAVTTLQLLATGTLGAGAATQLFVDWIAEPGELNGARPDDEHLADMRRLRRSVMDDFTRSVLRLEHSLPNSFLSKAW